MSFKLIATHVIFEPKFSMIATRTLHPSYSYFKNNTMRQKLSLTSELLYCCSLTTSGPPPPKLSRSYSTNFFAGSRSSRAENVDLYPKRPSSDLVNKYLKSLTGQASKPGGSLKKFEPCYRPLYPSKKCAQPTYKIPRKLPYIPAVFLKRKKPVIKYQKSTQATRKHPTLVQWPPLYKCKKRDVEQKPQEARPKTGNLPPWLLPLYSYKAGRPDEIGLAEARYCGGAFHRRMEFLQGFKVIRDKQQSLTNQMSEESTTKEAKKKSEPFISKRAAAVNDLKFKIGEMYAKIGSKKQSESFQRTQLIIKESEIAEGEKDRNSKQLNSASKYPIKTGVVADDSIRTHPKSSAAAYQHVVNKVSGYNFLSSINPRQVDPQPPISLQSSTETQGTNHKPVLESRTADFKLSSDSPPMEPSTIPHTTPGRKDQSLRKIENTVVDSNEWSVQSLKSRINEMLTIEEEKLKKITSKYKEVIEVQKPNSGGLRAHVSRPSNRSFHGCSKKTAESKLRTPNTTNRGDATSANNAHSVGSGLQLRSNCSRSYVGRRCLSTFSVSKGKERPKTYHSIYRRNSNQAAKFPVKKTNWITRIQRCFMIKRDKGVRVEDWKKTPRKIPCCVKDAGTSYSPSPVLWINKEKSVEQNQPENPVVRSNPAVLNAEQRIMASINRIVPTPIPKISRMESERTGNQLEEAVDSRLSEIEKKVRKAKIKVNILPFPWPNEVKSCDKVAKLPELSCSQHEKLSGSTSMFTGKEETGYEWIMNNKKIVEDIKCRRRQFAGKPLVPSHVKQSIEEYKLPLRAQISQYRKSIERKAHGLYFYSTARRWYSTTCYSPFPSFCYPKGVSFFNSQPTILQRSSMSGSGARNLSNNASQSSETPSPRTQLKQNTSRTALVGSEFYQKYALRPTCGDSSRDDLFNQLARDPNLTRNRGNLTMGTKVFPRRQAAPLTSPNKMLHRGAENSSVSLKKQVDDLKRLIRKSKGLDDVPEQVGVVYDQSQSNESYEVKLRKLVRAAQASTKKLKFVEPKYHLKNYPSIEKRCTTPESVRASEPLKPDSSTTSPFPSELGKDSRIESKTSKMKQQISQSVSLDSFHRNKKPFSRMYFRLKSFVESVRRKSTQETKNSRIIPTNKLKASTSLCSFLSPELVKKDGTKEIDTVHQVIEDSSSAPEAFELCCGQVATPASSIQLWKTEGHLKRSIEPGTSKPADVEDPKFVVDTVPSDHGDLMSMLSRAKELITFHSQLNVEELANTAKIMGKNSPEEIKTNLLTKRETVKSSTDIFETAVGQINTKLLENKTRFWPVLSSLPQSVLDKTDQDGANGRNSIVDQDTQKSFTETVIPSYGPTLNSRSIKEVKRETNETSRLAAALEEPIPASTRTSNPLISEEAYSPFKDTTENISVEPPNRVAERPEVNSENLQYHDPNTETGRFDLTYNRNCPNELVVPSDTNSSECQTIVPGDSGVVTSDVEPKCEHPGQSALHGVSSGKWELLSRNVKNQLPQVDASNAKHIEHEPCAPYPGLSKENVTCEGQVTENQQIVHTGNQDVGGTCERSGMCELSSPLNSYDRSQNNVSGSHSVSSQMRDTLKYTSGNTTAEEEVKLHYDEMKSPDRSTLTELLGKDPNINPELVKKLKLPAINPEDSSEKTWCTRPQNNLSNVQ